MNSTPKYVLASLVTYFKTWPRKEKERKGKGEKSFEEQQTDIAFSTMG